METIFDCYITYESIDKPSIRLVGAKNTRDVLKWVVYNSTEKWVDILTKEQWEKKYREKCFIDFDYDNTFSCDLYFRNVVVYNDMYVYVYENQNQLKRLAIVKCSLIDSLFTNVSQNKKLWKF